MSPTRSSPCRRVSIFPLVALLASLLSGCAAPTQFRPARTLEKGAIESSLTLHGLGFTPIKTPSDPDCYDCEGHGPSLRGVADPPSLPHPGYAIRYGITDELEFGAGLSWTTLRVDLTLEVLETPFLDLAVGAGIGADHLFLIPIAPSFSLPVIAGLNLRPWLVLTPYAALGGWIPLGTYDSLLVAETGIGLELRPTATFALRPHFARLWPLGPSLQDTNFLWSERSSALYSFGLDLVFGGSRN